MPLLNNFLQLMGIDLFPIPLRKLNLSSPTIIPRQLIPRHKLQNLRVFLNADHLFSRPFAHKRADDLENEAVESVGV